MLNTKLSFLVLGLVALNAMACAAPAEDDQEEEGSAESADSRTRSGTNSAHCVRSSYDCQLHTPGQRVMTPNTNSEDWGINSNYLAANAQGVPVLDGNGDLMGYSTFKTFTMNYGQSREFAGETYVYAMSTGLGSSGWVPMKAFGAADTLSKQVGEVTAKGDALETMGCYELASTYDHAKFDPLKVVKGAVAGGPEANDYLPQVRSNKKVYGTLSFNVPGDALGGANVDIFPAGTKFQRVQVPTWESPALPSLTAKLYKGTPANTAAGEMKFIYGYITSKTGEVRYGWAALDGLTVSSGCAAR